MLVVEHDEETMRAADHLVDFGPGAGEHGGEVVAAGHVAADGRAESPERSPGQYLAGKAAIEVPEARGAAQTGAI